MLSVVVPIYNEEENIAAFHDAVRTVMTPLGESWEVIFVNDGSRDRSLSLLLEIQQRDPHVNVVEFSRNFGHQAALTAGLQQNIDAYSTVGFDHTVYELGSALHEALTDPSAWSRWRNHEQAFLRASVTPTA